MRLETDPSERLLVAVIDGAPVGVAHLRRAPISPIHEEDAVHLGYLHVLSDFRRRGVGKALLETAADWADEKDSKHVVAYVAAAARDSNRFLARLGLGQVAVVRASTVASLRCELGWHLGGPQVGHHQRDRRAPTHAEVATRVVTVRHPPRAGWAVGARG